MKVNSGTNSSIQSFQSGQTRAPQGDTAAAGTSTPSVSSSGSSDGVSLSGLSSQIRSLASSGSGDIDTAHVESVKAALKNGTYSIDSGKIADGMLQGVRDTIKKSS